MPLHTCILNPSNHLKPSAGGQCTTVHNTMVDATALRTTTIGAGMRAGSGWRPLSPDGGRVRT